MISADKVRDLLDRTEDNIKLIEVINSDFAAPTLNEWRYLARHASMALCAESAESREQNVAEVYDHLKRAYFDSCDVAVDCYLEAMRKKTRPFRGWTEVVCKASPRYSEWIAVMRKAQDAHEKAQHIHGEGRVAAFNSLDPCLAELGAVYKELNADEDGIAMAVRRAKADFLIGMAAKLGALAVAFIAISKAIIWLFSLLH